MDEIIKVVYVSRYSLDKALAFIRSETKHQLTCCAILVLSLNMWDIISFSSSVSQKSHMQYNTSFSINTHRGNTSADLIIFPG